MKTAFIFFAVLALSACATNPNPFPAYACARTTVANACYWINGGTPNAAGANAGGHGAGYGAKSATSGGMAHG